MLPNLLFTGCVADSRLLFRSFRSGYPDANMAAEGDVDLDLEAEENCTGKPAEKPRKHDSGAADLERVTDYAEEKEISSSDLETVSQANHEGPPSHLLLPTMLAS